MSTGRRQARVTPCPATCGVARGSPWSSRQTRNTRMGRGMFLRCWAPRSVKARPVRAPTSSRTIAVTQIPPGSASACTRAATFKPSPYARVPSYITSPRLTPMRKRICCSGGTVALRSAIVRWIAMAHSTACWTLRNSARMPSPAVSWMRPPWASTSGRTIA